MSQKVSLKAAPVEIEKKGANETKTSSIATTVAIVTAKCEENPSQANQVAGMKLAVLQYRIRLCFKVVLTLCTGVHFIANNVS